MNASLKIGVVGVGSLGEHHVRIYSKLESVNLIGLFDANRQRASDVAHKYGTKSFENMEALAEQIDAASVAVPADKHWEIASALMERNIHLLVEKPIASTTQDAEAMVKMAEEKKLILQVGHVERFNPVMKYLEDILTQPGFIEAVRLAPYPPPRHSLSPRGTEVSVVLDLMIHDLEIVLHLVRSPIREFHAIGVPVLSSTEDIANVRLCFENRCVANISASRISRERIRKIRVFQENTYVSLDYQNQSGEIHKKTASGIALEKIPIDKGDPLENELATFADCVIRRNEPLVSGKHASEALRLAVAICEHIRKGGS